MSSNKRNSTLLATAPLSPVKKQKLSFNDYKNKKEPHSGNADRKNHSESHTTASKSVSDKVKTTSGIAAEHSKEATSKTTHGRDKNVQAKIPPVIVPFPTVPLSGIISSINSPKTFTHFTTVKSTFLVPTESVATSLAAATVSDDDALSKIFSSKNSKKMLYTGRKANLNGEGPKVAKLYDMAVKVLVSSLDELPHRVSIYNLSHPFSIPFSLLKPVLEKADSKQLSSVEYYSPNLLDDTDYIWKKLCDTEFKKFDPPEEDETWKDFYYKKCDEREENFERVRNSISQKQAAKPQKRQTQEATVRFVAKPNSVRLVSSAAASQNPKSQQAQRSEHIQKSSQPVLLRPIIRDEPVGKNSASGCAVKKITPSAPAMSQGMKATMKLMKKNMRR